MTHQSENPVEAHTSTPPYDDSLRFFTVDSRPIDHELEAPFKIPDLPFSESNLRVLNKLRSVANNARYARLWHQACEMVLKEEKLFPKNGVDMGHMHTFSSKDARVKDGFFENYYLGGVSEGDIDPVFKLAASTPSGPALLLGFARLAYRLGRIEQAYSLFFHEGSVHNQVLRAVPEMRA